MKNRYELLYSYCIVTLYVLPSSTVLLKSFAELMYLCNMLQLTQYFLQLKFLIYRAIFSEPEEIILCKHHKPEIKIFMLIQGYQ